MTRPATLVVLLALCTAAWALPIRQASARMQSPDALHWYRATRTPTRSTATATRTPDDVVRWYREHGYQFLVLTDHNFLTSVDGLNALHGADEQFLVDQRRRGHRPAAGQADSHQRPRRVRGRSTPQHGATVVDVVQRNVDAIRKAGGVPHMNHPNFRWAITADELRQARAHQAVRGLQRSSPGEQPRRRRRSRHGGSVGSPALERQGDVRHRRRRCARVQAAGQSRRARAGTRLGHGACGAPGAAADCRRARARRLLRVDRRRAERLPGRREGRDRHDQATPRRAGTAFSSSAGTAAC